MNYMNALMDPASVGQGMQNAFQGGMDARRQRETMNALAGYAQNQSPEGAQAVSQHDPMLGLQLQDREDERQAAQLKAEELRYKQELQQRAAQGDPAALAELAGIDIAAWDTISDQEKQEVGARVDFIGQAALAVSQLPEAQRPMAWDSYVMQGAQRFPELAEYVGKYSPDALNAALAQAGQVKQFIDLTRPSYQVIPEGGVMVNTRDPQAAQQFAPVAYDPNEWEIVGDAGSNASGGF